MENVKGSSDGEDIPSDFFDDFSKDEFIEGLSVIDSWDDDDKKPSGSRTRAIVEKMDRVKRSRELIDRKSQDENRDRESYESRVKRSIQDPACQKRSNDKKREGSTSHLNDYIKPGSRRDPSKTNEAIKRDKEEKVKEYLAKHLESSDDLRPPGTELDDYFEEQKFVEIKKMKEAERNLSPQSPPRRHRISPVKYRRDSPVRRRESPLPFKYHRKAWSPPQKPYIPRRSPHRNFRNYAHKPFRSYHHGSPRRRSPDVVIRRERRSRSPYKRAPRRSRSRSLDRRHVREAHRKSHSRSSNHMSGTDDFLYPKSYPYPTSDYSGISEMPYPVTPAPQYAEPIPVEYSYKEPQAPSYSYAPGPAYSGYGASYDYEQPTTMVMPVPQPVPAPVMALTTTNPSINPVQQPTMVPPPQQMTSVMSIVPDTCQNTPTDALAKLVADGKLSHEDYLKLAPNKGAPQAMDTQSRVTVLNRCHNALSRLGYIALPNRLLINNVVGNEQKQIVSKYCSPLKRQAVSDFYFTKFNPSVVAQNNKQIVDAIIAALDIEKVVGKSKKKPHKDTKDVAVQTTRPFCEMCEIRESTKCNEVGTSIDAEHFTSTVHTQVVEQELYSSRAVFNPTGGAAEGANMSIAHMTPAQLVSQLAARAKTLKQSEPPPGQYRHDPRYDYDGRGDQYRNFNHYRY